MVDENRRFWVLKQLYIVPNSNETWISKCQQTTIANFATLIYHICRILCHCITGSFSAQRIFILFLGPLQPSEGALGPAPRRVFKWALCLGPGIVFEWALHSLAGWVIAADLCSGSLVAFNEVLCLGSWRVSEGTLWLEFKGALCSGPWWLFEEVLCMWP